MSFYTVFWIILMAAAGVTELLTSSLVSIWFVFGAAAAFLLSLLSAPVLLQWLSFAVVSLLVLVLFRGKIAEKLRKQHVATNADSLIGKELPLTETVDNEKGSGRLVYGDQDWMARAERGGAVIGAGSLVKVLRIEGAKVIVRPVKEAAEPAEEAAGQARETK